MNNYVKNTCKAGQPILCCRFLLFGKDGFECAKNTYLRDELDFKAEHKLINARGNYCKGKTTKILNSMVL